MKKGFTLVELLAVIVILAIILAIAIPSISNIISATTKGTMESDTKLLLKAIQYKILDDDDYNIASINETNIKSILNISDENYQSVDITVVNGNPFVSILGKNKWDNLFAYGTYTNINVKSAYEGLAAYWKLDGNANDSSGNGVNGTIYGATLTINNKGESNKAYAFDGTDDYIDFGNNIILSNNSPFSYLVWIKFSTSQYTRTIMGRHTNAIGGANLGIDNLDPNKIKFHLNAYASQRVNSTIALNDGLWHHICGTWDGSALKLYIDGELNNSATVAATLTFPTANYQVGRWVGGAGEYFNGSLDDVRVYNRLISADEVRALYYITK